MSSNRPVCINILIRPLASVSESNKLTSGTLLRFANQAVSPGQSFSASLTVLGVPNVPEDPSGLELSTVPSDRTRTM